MTKDGRNWWRSFEERAGDPAFLDALAREFPGLAKAYSQGIDRRRALQLMAASVALAGLSGCGPSEPPEKIVPRVDQDASETAGVAQYVATAIPREGYATGALLQHRVGRPLKVEGNPDHPASLGASDPIMQAMLLDLYDPERSTSVLNAGRIRDWRKLEATLADKRANWSRDGGQGLRILTGRMTSPSLAAQMAALLRQYPQARWHSWEPLPRDSIRAGATLAFGRQIEVVPLFDRADIVLAIESDAISAAPGHLAFARAFAQRRRAAETGGMMSRVYAIESTPTLIGASADHRFALKPGEIELALRALAGKVSAGPAAWAEGTHPAWIEPLARDLAAHKGAVLVHAGPEQSPVIHALVHALNAALGAVGRTLRYQERIDIDPGATIADLAADMQAGRVDTLVMLECNPVYDAPADLDFRAALKRVSLSVHLATHADETAFLATFHAPALHLFESWGDARAFDGTVSILQPQIKPLVVGRSRAEMIALLSGQSDFNVLKAVQEYWRPRASGDFDATWTAWLRKGVLDGTAAPVIDVALRAGFAEALPPPIAPQTGIALLFRPDPFLRGGALANSGWLQELPRPMTRLVWDNAALIAPATAERLKLQTQDVIELATASGKISLPVLVLPGQAEDCVTLPLGFGHKVVGKVGADIGVNVYPLRSSARPWGAAVTGLRATGERRSLAMTQLHQDMDGRDIVRVEALADFLQKPPPGDPIQPSLYPPHQYTGNAWAMAINLNSCIGCGGCAAACQAENNIPVVGREEVMRGREMHWIRVDRYWGGEPANPNILFQPVACMHCEEAPCEVVCPVGATVHDSDGLNTMVYNRCVGTRFCSNNCPYKVRRFNFFDYAEQENRPAISRNPEVTVRARGVMEKCTYCIQRIRETKITADRENRPIADGEIKTACQQACPTEAIVFGDLNDPKSEVVARKASPLNYSLLDELGTRPRTTYGARLSNRNPEIAEG